MKQPTIHDFRGAVIRIQTLYSTPPVLSRALRLIRDPGTSVLEITELVRRDAALSADFLHLANSAMFRRGTFCTHLSEAIQRLGMNELLRLIGLSLSKNVFGKDLSNYGITASQYWTESVWAAVAMETLAERHGVDADEAYIAGLLHQLGRVLINEALLEVGWSLFWNGREPVETWELDHVGFTHADAGALLLREWEFPESFIEAIAQQAGAPEPGGQPSLSGLLRFTRQCLVTADPAHLWRRSFPPIPAEERAWAGLEAPDALADFLEATTLSLQTIRRMLNGR